jgi:hypothetical protein
MPTRARAKRKALEVNGPHTLKVILVAKKEVPQIMLARIPKNRPDLFTMGLLLNERADTLKVVSHAFFSFNNHGKGFREIFILAVLIKNLHQLENGTQIAF